MTDRDNRWHDERRWENDERSMRRPGGERDFYRRDEYSEDRYGLGYGEEGLTNYRLRGSGMGQGNDQRYRSYGGGERDVVGGGAYGRGNLGRQAYGRNDWSRGGGFQDDFTSEFPSDYTAGRRELGGLGYGGSYNPRGYDENRGYYGRERDRSRSDEDRGFFNRASDEVSSWFGDDDAERRRRRDAELDMRHQGRGPKGYRRSDDRIREDVSDRLTDDPFIDATEIEIVVSNAEVTLTGSVDSRNARRRAEDLAERISGVTHVQNNLRVTSGSDSTRQERDAGATQKTGLFSSAKSS